jgi:hypothetical protein
VVVRCKSYNYYWECLNSSPKCVWFGSSGCVASTQQALSANPRKGQLPRVDNKWLGQVVITREFIPARPHTHGGGGWRDCTNTESESSSGFILISGLPPCTQTHSLTYCNKWERAEMAFGLLPELIPLAAYQWVHIYTYIRASKTAGGWMDRWMDGPSLF